ncbi:hypothetical protein [Brevundimonas sp.]|uniref:hypothetical protein n=1 Tax=Brevundimonas sp. TaxID=1871086 RepID=UPI002D2739DE|nr:hypothetical protein [Brevundimonas sp.]HYC97395.1 hypothetical protein [Brevundimonas sp.]
MKIAIRNRALLSLAAATAILVATPALAQNYEAEYYGYGENHPYDVWGRDIEQRQNALEQAVRRAASTGQLGQGEARRLSGAFNQLERVKATYRHRGYSRAEVNDINRRLERIEAVLRYGGRGYDRRDRDDYGRDDYRRDDYGRGGYDRYDR